MYSLIKDTPALLAQKEISIQTNKKGALTVYNRIPEQDAILISAPKPMYIDIQLNTVTIAKALDIDEDAIDTRYPIELIDAGLRTLIVPFKDLATEIPIFPNEQQLKCFCIEHDIDILLIIPKAVEVPGHIAHTRVFAPKFGYLEDLATVHLDITC